MNGIINKSKKSIIITATVVVLGGTGVALALSNSSDGGDSPATTQAPAALEGDTATNNANELQNTGGSTTTSTMAAGSMSVLPPAAANPGLGYAEFAGWVPGGQQLLMVRESRAEGRYSARSFEVVDLPTLTVQRRSGEAQQLGAFRHNLA